MLLLDEMNQYASKDSTDSVFDLLRVVDNLSNTTRGQMQVKHAQRSWDIFRKRMRENYPKAQRPQTSNQQAQNQDEAQLPPEPDYINRLRNKLVGDQTLSSTIKGRFAKRLKRYDSLPVQNADWDSKEANVSNLVTKFTEHLSKGRTLLSSDMREAMDACSKSNVTSL